MNVTFNYVYLLYDTASGMLSLRLGKVYPSFLGRILEKFAKSCIGRWAESFVGWVSDSVTHASVGVRSPTATYILLNLIVPTYLHFFKHSEKEGI